MTSLAPIDVHTQLTAPAEPQTRSAHQDGGGFAETLQRRTNADDAAKRPSAASDAKDEPTPTRPQAPKAKDDSPTKAAKNSTETDTATDPAEPPAAIDDTTGANDTIPDAALPLMLPAVAQPVVTAQNAPAEADVAPGTELALIATAPQGKALLANLGGNVDDSKAAGVIDAATALVSANATTATPEGAARAAGTSQAPVTPTTANLQTPVSAEDITAVVANTPAITLANPANSAVTNGDTRVSLTAEAAAGAANTEVAADAALPPVTAGDDIAPVVLAAASPSSAANETSAAPSVSSAPLAAQPLNTATPATQSTAMNAVASSLGVKDKPKAEDAASTTNTGKSLSEAPTTLAAPAPTTPVVNATRPLSEAVLAQSTLAANGNAMEKVVSQQVTKALVQNLPNGDKMMVLRLTPPELGTVKIEVIERQGVLSARLHAEDDGVRLALERFLPSMRQDLRAHDAPIRELSLSDQAQFQRSFADGQQQNQHQDTHRSGNRREREDTPRFSLDGIRSEPVAVPRSTPLGARVSLAGVDARA